MVHSLQSSRQSSHQSGSQSSRQSEDHPSQLSTALGKHILVEFYHCTSANLKDTVYIEQSMIEAAVNCGATIVNSWFHDFSPLGVSGVVIIQESHLTIHTWPEYNYAAVDLFTCGHSIDPWIAYKSLEHAFKSDHISITEIDRGSTQFLTKQNPDNQAEIPLSSQPNQPLKIQRETWFTERNIDIALSFRVKDEQLFTGTSPFQTIKVFDTHQYGRMLVIDDRVMCSERDEYAYHEMIVHVPLFSHPKVKDVLVVGGGDGGTVRELLKHPQVEHITMVEIDQFVMDTAKQFFPTLSAALAHPKLTLIIANAVEYIQDCADASYDLIIIDSSDPIGPSQGLFTSAFYQQVYRALKPDGVMVAQSESPQFNQTIFKEIYACQRAIFDRDHVYCYLTFIPTYPTGMWSFSYCTKSDLSPIDDFANLAARTFTQDQQLNYYNETIHVAAFSLPNFVQAML